MPKAPMVRRLHRGEERKLVMDGTHMGGVSVFFSMTLFWILIVLGVFLLLRLLTLQSRGSGGPSREDTALDILKKRYAKGEISKEDFDRMKKDLAA